MRALTLFRATIVLLVARVALAQGTPAKAQMPEPGDQIRIAVWPQSAFGPPITAIVDGSGIIIVPPIGMLNVGQIPLASLRDTVRARLLKFIREPEVDVQLGRRITVNGAVMRPDIYFMDPSAKLRDVIARAGGVTEVGNRKKVTVIRDGVSVRVSDWETDTSDRSLLQSGDQVVIGRRSWIEINIIPVASLGLATASFLLSLRR